MKCKADFRLFVAFISRYIWRFMIGPFIRRWYCFWKIEKERKLDPTLLPVLKSLQPIFFYLHIHFILLLTIYSLKRGNRWDTPLSNIHLCCFWIKIIGLIIVRLTSIIFDGHLFISPVTARKVCVGTVFKSVGHFVKYCRAFKTFLTKSSDFSAVLTLLVFSQLPSWIYFKHTEALKISRKMREKYIKNKICKFLIRFFTTAWMELQQNQKYTMSIQYTHNQLNILTQSWS